MLGNSGKTCSKYGTFYDSPVLLMLICSAIMCHTQSWSFKGKVWLCIERTIELHLLVSAHSFAD
jgi:hypothetical protein